MRKHIYIFSILLLSCTQSYKACWGPDKGTQFVSAAAAYIAVHGSFVATDVYRAVKNRLETPIRNGAGERPMPFHNPNYEQMRAIQDSRNEYARKIYSFILNPKNS